MADSEAAVLRRELAAAITGLDKLKQEFAGLGERYAALEKENAGLRARLALYESPNMPTSQPSLYNAERKRFRESRGEDPGGNPGDGARGKKRGPPAGHAGVSHSNAPAVALRYGLGSAACRCGGALVMLRPVGKLVTDFDPSMRMVTANAVIQRAGCGRCGRTAMAPAPFLEGTSLGPVALSVVMALFDLGCTDRDISRFFHAVFGFRMAPNTVAGARHAAAAALGDLIRAVAAAIQLLPWVQIDETKFRRGDGHWGYVWVVYAGIAVYVVFTPNREAANLAAHFGWLAGMAAVCDGYAGYPGFFGMIQRCWRHLLSDAEKLAVKNGGADEARYDALLSFYNRIKKMETLAPLTCTELSRQAYRIAASYGDADMGTTLRNALPHMFAFLSCPGMPPHNNDTERAIRDGIIPQRNARHKTVTAEGREAFSRLLTFTLTARRQGMSAARAFLEYLLDRNWDIFQRAPDTPYSLVNPDGTRYCMFDCPGPPGLPAARQGRTAAAQAAPALACPARDGTASTHVAMPKGAACATA